MSTPYPLPARLWKHWSAHPRFKQFVSGGVAVVLLIVAYQALSTNRLPDFRDYEDVSAKKEAFFSYLLPYVADVNRSVLADREKLLRIRDEFTDSDSAGPFDDRWVKTLAADYELEVPEQLSLDFVDRLLRRVDIIAPSLVLAQAATESGWGTSRFARQGNNLFGMRDYSGGGLVPKGRPKGATWTVADYETPGDSIRAFVHNLNTGSHYRQLRTIRRDLRRRDAPVTGLALANGLRSYSEKGYEYVAQVQSMIRSNDLAQYDS